MCNHKAAVFILLGQSNAVGHGIPMKDDDKITVPMKNVFGLSRKLNQTYGNETLYWSGYTSGGMNLAEEQDDTYSVANCLAKFWQNEIDSGNKQNLPDLYIVHIAIGAQGVSEKYIEAQDITKKFMWNPDYEKKLIPGKLGEVDISLYPFTVHILSKIKESIRTLGKAPEIIGLHWRGGEEDAGATDEVVQTKLEGIYNRIFDGFYAALDEKIPIILHKIVDYDRCLDCDSTGASLKRVHYINNIFEEFVNKNDNISIFDPCNAPQYIPDVRGNGIFIDDVVHFTPEVNCWVAEEILKNYISSVKN